MQVDPLDIIQTIDDPSTGPINALRASARVLVEGGSAKFAVDSGVHVVGRGGNFLNQARKMVTTGEFTGLPVLVGRELRFSLRTDPVSIQPTRR